MGTLGENSLRTRIGRYHGRRDILISASHEIILNLLILIELADSFGTRYQEFTSQFSQ